MSLSTSPRLGDVTTRRPATRLRRLLAAVGVITTLVLISTVANALVTAAEKSSLPSYGQTVSLEAGDVNVVRSGGSGPTMVLLSGYGTPAPAVDFAPLIRELDDFDVIVIEGFGYGYSDLDVPERSVVGHSAGGLYARYYATTYPGEVSAIIGIDPMAATTASTEVGTPSVTEGVQRTLGLYRWVTGIVPELIQPPGDAYTPAERVQIAALSNWNYGNASLADEWSRLEATSTTVGQRPFPADIPVLEFLSSDSIASIPDWLTNHEDELVGVTTHRLEVLEGAHYLHWTQSPALATTISEFLAANLPQ
jgi:pimeloyl-ACP methyl ester carboxylesterase